MVHSVHSSSGVDWNTEVGIKCVCLSGSVITMVRTSTFEVIAVLPLLLYSIGGAREGSITNTGYRVGVSGFGNLLQEQLGEEEMLPG